MNAGLRGFLMLGVFVAMAVAAYIAAQAWQQSRNSFERDPAVGACTLQQGQCGLDVDGLRVTFSIDPGDIPLMQTLRLRVRVGGAVPASIAVEIRGLNMEMGLNRTRLERAEDGSWSGETILPICSQRRMEWEAAVQLDGKRRIELPFLFETTRP